MRERGSFLEFDQPNATTKALISPKHVTAIVDQGNGVIALSLVGGVTVNVNGDCCDIAEAIERF